MASTDCPGFPTEPTTGPETPLRMVDDPRKKGQRKETDLAGAFGFPTEGSRRREIRKEGSPLTISVPGWTRGRILPQVPREPNGRARAWLQVRDWSEGSRGPSSCPW